MLLCGNGGSAADCAHILGELVKGFCQKRPLPAELASSIGEDWAKDLQQGLPVIDLTANCAVISAIVNDIDGASMFAQQVIAYAAPGDVLIAISTSGNAENVRRAAVVARAKGAKVIGMTGQTGGALARHCDLLLNVPQDVYKRQGWKKRWKICPMCAWYGTTACWSTWPSAAARV